MKNNPLRRTQLAVVAACIGLAAALVPAHARLSATRPVVAVLNGDLFVGQAEGYLDGSGTIAIHSQQNLALTCLGEFATTAKLGGSGTLLCSDGENAKFRIHRLTIYKGHGSGTTSRGSMSFVYGLSAAESARYLDLPNGKKFAAQGHQLVLVDF